MNLRDLRYVVALADTGHFRKAAEKSFVSQSTLSIQIKQLEELLGVMIFDRTVTPIQPTERGQVIIESARRILTEADLLRQWAKGLTDPMAITLHLGVIPTLAPYYLPQAMQVLQTQLPQLKLILLELQTPEIILRLHKGTLDGAILALPINEGALQSEEILLFRERFVAVYPTDFERQSPHSTATLEDMPSSAEALPLWFRQHTHLPMLLLEEGHCLRGQALSACQLTDPVAEPVRATSLETLRQMVAQGLGWTLMPALSTPLTQQGVGWADRRLQYSPIHPAVYRHMGLVFRKKSPLTETLTSLAKIWQSHLPQGVEAIESR